MKLLPLLPLAALALTAACAGEKSTATTLAPGTYQKTTTNTNAAGTKTTQTDRTDVMVDEYGNKTAVVQSKKTQDPRGLFNKSTSTSTQVIQER